MKKFYCILDNVFFNKKRYNTGDLLQADDELAKEVNKNWFETEEEYNKRQQVIVEKVKSAVKDGLSVKDVIARAESEKKIMAKDYEKKIESLEKQLNPKVKNAI